MGGQTFSRMRSKGSCFPLLRMRDLHFSQKHLRCLGSRLVSRLPRGERGREVDGKETVEIACGELRWEGARQHAGRKGKHANSLRKASLGRSETACWTDSKTVEIACGKLRWEGARQHAGRTGRWEGARQHAGRKGKHGNSLRKASLRRSETACWTDRKPWK